MARKKASPKQFVRCPTCAYEADSSAGAVNFCPGCGADLRADPHASITGAFVHRVIADRYRLLALVGEGGMGAVFKAEHIRMGKALALKILRGDFAREPGAVERFLAEARMVSRLSHPHTIAVFDFGEIDAAGSGFYLAMEYVPGKDLATVLRETGPLPEQRVSEIGQQILGSLAEAHDAGIVHRDVKPGNVMLMQTRSGEDFVKVLDFGIAKLRHAGPEPAAAAAATSASETSAGAIVGTPSYVAPEQARGGSVDARSDLYAVGCLLYELAAGRPPFVAPSPMAVVAAHLNQPPPPLGDAVSVSRRFAEVIHRALRKRPEERFATADAMREALGNASEPTGARPLPSARAPAVTGALRIASREDFAEFDRQVRALRRGRMLAPVFALLALLAAATTGLAAWRWADVYAFAAARAPGLAALVPAALRPDGASDGEEHEPNDVPSRANPLRLPPAPDGQPAGGTGVVRGHVGAKLSEASGDVDIYRIEIPATDGKKVLVAEWHGERSGEGIRGLDVTLALNREREPGDGRGSAPLVASVSRGGAGRPETLVAAVDPGVHYLSVREHHDEATGPVEKPTDWYVLEVRLATPEPGQELEPNDAPDRLASRFERYAEWRAIAERNPLAEGEAIHGDTGPDDPDAFAVEPRPGGAPELVVAVPEAALALSTRLWTPDDEDVASSRAEDRVRFADAAEGAPGQVVVVTLAGAPRRDAPALVQLRAASGQGKYEVVALGRGAASGAAVAERVRALAEAGRAPQALELAAAFAAGLPDAASRDDVLRLAGEIAEGAAARIGVDGVAAFEHASRLLGTAVLEVADGKVSYRGAFDDRAAPVTPTRAPGAAAR
jgi:serine/threonine-protein kinase